MIKLFSKKIRLLFVFTKIRQKGKTFIAQWFMLQSIKTNVNSCGLVNSLILMRPTHCQHCYFQRNLLCFVILKFTQIERIRMRGKRLLTTSSVVFRLCHRLLNSYYVVVPLIIAPLRQNAGNFILVYVCL